MKNCYNNKSDDIALKISYDIEIRGQKRFLHKSRCISIKKGTERETDKVFETIKLFN